MKLPCNNLRELDIFATMREAKSIWMLRSYSIFIFILGCLVGLQHCANPIAPTGGVRDEIPPAVDTAYSTANYQTNFTKQDIILTFDEWVVLKDVFNQVIVSPPLNRRPEISIKKKSVIVEFDEDEVLRQDATYTINFGEAVQDLTEGNAATDLRFIFSTGDYIDSLTVRGSIKDALTGEPVEDVIFALYDNLADSVVRTERPFYFAKTNKEGNFKVENIKADTFKIFAIKDANLNYLFDQISEPIAFSDTVLILSEALNQSIELSLFREEPPLLLEDVINDNFGLIKLAFNKLAPPINISSNDPALNWQTVYKEDTVNVWYSTDVDTSTVLYVSYDTLVSDTIGFSRQRLVDFREASALKQENLKAGRQVTTLNPAKPIELIFNHPIASFNKDSIVLLADTSEMVVVPTISIDTANIRKVSVNYPWQPNLEYKLEILPGAIADIFELSNADTLTQLFKGGDQKDFGSFNLNFTQLDSAQQYIVKLFKNSSELIDTYTITDVKAKRIIINSLTPGKYEVHLISDLNRNGQWDTGNYDLKLQPEPYLKRTLEQLRANWEVESEISPQTKALDQEPETDENK